MRLPSRSNDVDYFFHSVSRVFFLQNPHPEPTNYIAERLQVLSTRHGGYRGSGQGLLIITSTTTSHDSCLHLPHSIEHGLNFMFRGGGLLPEETLFDNNCIGDN